MRKDLIINGQDAFDEWGIILGDNAINALLAPPAMKAYIENESRLQHGTQIIPTDKVASRDVQLTLYLKAKNSADYALKYAAFIEELRKGIIEFHVISIDTTFKMLFTSCQQYTAINTLGKFIFRFVEPNPADRL